MLKKKVEKAINDQINAELYSAYMYYSMAAYFESLSLKGAAHWMDAQAIEEMFHASKFATYVSERGGRVVLKAIEAPPTEWKTPLACFEAVAAHEAHVTDLINKLMALATAENDYATANMLQWFISEQVEEEATAGEVVQKLKLVDKTEGGLFMVDLELAKRPFKIPPVLAGAAIIGAGAGA
jgi:ferritin